jgi:hypothetical protein
MRFLRRAMVLLTALSGPAAASAADLARIDRTIAKEPPYHARPLYCLLVFGPEARSRAWLVMDGDSLYVDRHADGDLTHPHDRLRVRSVTPHPGDPVRKETRVFFDTGGDGRDARLLKDTDRYQRLWVSQAIPRDRPVLSEESQRNYLDQLRSHSTTVFLVVGKYRQLGWARFAERAGDAPILHFDGPLTLGPGRDFGPFKAEFVRGPVGGQLIAGLETHGLGRGAVVTMDTRYPPADVHPVAEIDFPSREPGGKPIRVRVLLKERC